MPRIVSFRHADERAFESRGLATLHAMEHERFLVTTRRILDGDDSIQAAQASAGVVIDEYQDDERLEELAEVLALYAGGQPRPSSSAQEVRTVIQEAITSLS
jgi:hypothetical protein